MEDNLTSNTNQAEIKAESQENVGNKSGHYKQHVASIIVSLLPCMFGAAVGWASPTLSQLESETSPIGHPLTEAESTILNSVLFLGGIIGITVWPKFTDKFGRKITGYLVAAILIIAWLIIECTSDIYSLCAARIITGFSGSGTLLVCCLYISEIADDDIRGTLGSYPVFFMNLGILYSYCWGALVSYRILAGICLILPILFLILFFWLPESPGYLWRANKRSASEHSLNWFKGNDLTKVEREMLKLSNLQFSEKNVSYLTLFSTRANRMGMLIGFGIFAEQQFCGIFVVLTYASKILNDAGSSLDSDVSTIFIGLFQLVFSGLSVLLVERCGRKLLLLISFLSMGVALAIEGLYFYLKEESSVNTADFAWLPVVMLCIYISVFAIGVGPVPFVIMTEIFSPDIRSLASSVIILVNSLFTFIVVLIFPLIGSLIGSYGNFWLFSAFCFSGFIFTLLVVPETRNKPITDILAKLAGN